MCNEKLSVDVILTLLEDPIKNMELIINDETIMKELKWRDPELYKYILRLDFIYLMSNHEKIYICPECHKNIITDESGEEYCSNCGLVTRTHYDYAAGLHLELPFGRK